MSTATRVAFRPRFLFLLPLQLVWILAWTQRPEPAQPSNAWLVDATESAGLSFVHDPGTLGTYFMPEMVGSGVALFDFDNDGLLDIYLLQNGGPDSPAKNRLLRQTREGTFVDVSAGSGLDVSGRGMGVAVADVNNDGYSDVLVTEYGRLRLFVNEAGRTFVDETRAAGLENLLWGVSAAFVDFDRDGWLDLVVVNYIDYTRARPCSDGAGNLDYCGPSAFPGSVTRLFHNLGPSRAVRSRNAESARVVRPRFEDVTLQSGLGRLPGPGLGVVTADFSGDRWPDIFVANDGQPNRLWINQHNGTFKDEGLVRGIALNQNGGAEANMGVALGDVDGDNRLDVFVTHLTEENHTLWRRGTGDLFNDVTAVAGLASPKWHGTGFGTVFGDFDNDGDLDLAVVNGRVKRPALNRGAARAGGFAQVYGERSQLFENDGMGRFRDVSLANAAFSGTPQWARALAVGDLNNDGALDLLVTTVGGPARLYRNVAPGRGHWLMVRAVDPSLRRDAYGALVTISAGAKRAIRSINPAYGYLTSNDPRAHFGLGRADRVDSIDVIWPDGTDEQFPGADADRQIVLRKGEGRPRSSKSNP